LAAVAALVVLFTLFEAATFRRAAPAGFFATPTLELVGFRFESFVAAVLALARLALAVLRATRVFDTDLLFATRLRALDEEAPFVVCFDLGFALEAEPVFFVFELVVFLDLLGATIVNLSTRKLSAHATDPARTLLWFRARILFLERRVDFFGPGSHLRLRQGRPATSARRLICRLAQIRRKIKEEDKFEPIDRVPVRSAAAKSQRIEKGLIALPRFCREKIRILVSASVEVLAIRRRLFLTGYIRP
jgi:hypothetical protein